MTHPSYDKTSIASIVDYAKGLTGKTLRDFMLSDEIAGLTQNVKNKGDLGNLVERFYFDINPGNSPKPDFPDAGLELKTAAVERYVKPRNGLIFHSKDRLKLSKINYGKVGSEVWDANSLFQKCERILLLMSLYDGDLEVIDRLFILNPILWELPDKDLEFIKADWEIIQQKIEKGLAHELSGSDTKYLEACTSGKGDMLKQPFSDELAVERSFAFKSSYVTNSFLANAQHVEKLEPVLKEGESPKDFEKIIASRVGKYRNQSINEIAASINYELSSSKQRLALLSYKILGIKSRKAEEFVKSGIEIKTVNFKPNGTPAQDTSFPAFAYMDIVNEEWEDSVFKQKIDTKVLFMIYETDANGIVFFRKAHFWSMPTEDFEEARRVWAETKFRIIDGRANYLPTKKFSTVAHVRNHAANSKPENRIETPLNGRLPVKGFWLNALYVKKQLGHLL